VIASAGKATKQTPTAEAAGGYQTTPVAELPRSGWPAKETVSSPEGDPDGERLYSRDPGGDFESESPDMLERGGEVGGARVAGEEESEFADLEALIERRKREITARLEAKREKEKLDETMFETGPDPEAQTTPSPHCDN